MLEFTDYTERSELLKQQVKKAFSDAGKNLVLRNNDSGTIRLVFAGQYSAGKSSILKMLTGRDDIEKELPLNKLIHIFGMVSRS